MTKKTLAHVINVVAGISVSYWLLIYFFNPENLLYFEAFGLALILVPLLGLVYAALEIKSWGGLKSSVGRTIGFIMVSITAWTLGEILFVWYAMATGDVPHPGPPDAFFVLMDPFYALAMLSMLRYTGALKNFRVNKVLGGLVILVIPAVSIYINYVYLFGAEPLISGLSDPELLFDLIYTFGSTSIMALIGITIILSSGRLGGKMRYALYFIFVGIILQYTGDIMYSYAEFENEAFSGGPADFVFFLSLYAVILGLQRLDTNKLND